MSRLISDKLLEKSKAAMISAIQIYNNPSINFKSEIFIVLAIIAWTYLMHSYYRKNKIIYKYYRMNGSRIKYDKTKYGAIKCWELERCITDSNSPLDRDTINNLKFLIGIRNEIEHQSTESIDEYISAKLQACALNYNRTIIECFGNRHNIGKDLNIAIQMSPISPEQEKLLRDNKDKIPSNVRSFITKFETELTDSDLNSLKYSYRLVYLPISVNRKGQADKAVRFIPAESEDAKNVEKILLKQVEKEKFLPGKIVEIMKNEGYINFNMHEHTMLWKEKDAKNKMKNYGTYVVGKWYWYKNWVEQVRIYCQKKYRG